MDPSSGKPSFLRNILVRLFLLSVLLLALRFAHLVTSRGESCDVGDFCFFSLPQNLNVVAGIGQLTKSSSALIISSSANTPPSAPKRIPHLWTTQGFQKAVSFYSSVFQDLISDAFLAPNFKALCLETATGADVFALREIGVEDSVGISKKAFKPLVISGQSFKQPFDDESLDFVFCGGGVVEKSVRLGDFAAEVGRTMKPEGFLVVHTAANDTYSFQSFLGLFSSFTFVKSRDIGGFESKMPYIREIVMQKIGGKVDFEQKFENSTSADSVTKCNVPSYKRELIRKAEPLIEEEPKKPWITLKKNVEKIKYLPTMVDISFKPKYVYVDVGARSYGSSIVSWFKKHYPKQNKTFDIYAIEADKTFHDDYKGKKGVTLLPYAAWVK
ncbi:UNVERIFIED_CONTAM: hypothetical protein Sradi_5522100 [Sesamum radiatum]|uniref:DUF7870 domain-containing protein n=1 Tax=Sesamum radiatum TaxID=300843 RepID=A0AAW2LBG7_SESRA